MIRAVLEGVAYNLKIILNILEGYSPVEEIVMIGGGAQGETWLRIFADVWQKPLIVPQYLEEATSMGAAICGGIGIGVYSDFLVAEKFNKIVKTVKPDKDKAEAYRRMFGLFCEAYCQLKPVYKSLTQSLSDAGKAEDEKNLLQ
jgi:xylulokinase